MGCQNQVTNTATSLAKVKREVSATDINFSRMCIEKGMKAAFLHYADSTVIKLENGQYPVIGKQALEASFGSEREPFYLEWRPERVEVAASQDLAYTFGYWELRSNDTTSIHGAYVTIWKKQKDGSWKYVLDSGGQMPGTPKK